MGKRLLAIVVFLAFAAPAGLASVPQSRLSAPAHVAGTFRAVPSAEPAQEHALREGPVARLLARVDRVMESLNPQENALAELLTADSADEVRGLEERMSRHGEAPRNRRWG